MYRHTGTHNTHAHRYIDMHILTQHTHTYPHTRHSINTYEYVSKKNVSVI